MLNIESIDNFHSLNKSSTQSAAGWLLYGAQTLALLSADVERRSGK